MVSARDKFLCNLSPRKNLGPFHLPQSLEFTIPILSSSSTQIVYQLQSFGNGASLFQP